MYGNICKNKTFSISYPREFNVDSKAESGQLNLANVIRNKKYKKETKTRKRQCPLSLVQVKAVQFQVLLTRHIYVLFGFGLGL